MHTVDRSIDVCVCLYLRLYTIAVGEDIVQFRVTAPRPGQSLQRAIATCSRKAVRKACAEAGSRRSKFAKFAPCHVFTSHGKTVSRVWACGYLQTLRKLRSAVLIRPKNTATQICLSTRGWWICKGTQQICGSDGDHSISRHTCSRNAFAQTMHALL